MGVTGLIGPGDQLAYQGQGQSETWRGYVLGVSISAPGSGAVNVSQTAPVIRYPGHRAQRHPWRKFTNMLPGNLRTVVTITANIGDGTSNATTRDGTAIVVKG